MLHYWCVKNCEQQTWLNGSVQNNKTYSHVSAHSESSAVNLIITRLELTVLSTVSSVLNYIQIQSKYSEVFEITSIASCINCLKPVNLQKNDAII